MTSEQWAEGLRLLAAYKTDDRLEGALGVWMVDHADELLARPPGPLTHTGGPWPQARLL